MLQRAASNAYSWWWASHIRTKQSKWLEQNLQDMEDKVESALKLIQEDGDSFAKRAEMYYKKRPELINFVEESYRAYRALAERYDHISTELQNANNTIATVFPERVQFAMDEDDENGSPRIEKFPQAPKPNIPKVPKLPSRDLKGLLTSATKKLQVKKALKTAFTDSAVAKSGLSKPEAVEEIDKLQKGILALQTEKEFVKSSYEHGLAKYWEIEKHIKEKHDKICSLQDEFNVGRVIEDDEARTLMAAAALRSCQESLAHLQDKQERSADEARVEHERIKDARKKLRSLKKELLPSQVEQDKPANEGETLENLDQEHGIVTQEIQQLESLREKIKEYFEEGSNATLTVTEMAENIDELVNKVISLETAVLSQTVLIKRLQTETDELHAQISSLEGDKVALMNGSDDVSAKLIKMEVKLNEIQDLNQNAEDQNNHLQTHFTQAHCSLDQLTEKLHSMKPDEELKAAALSDKQDGSLPEVKSHKDSKIQDNPPDLVDNFEKVHQVNPDEKLVVTGSLQKEEEGQKDPPRHGDDESEKAWDTQVEAREDSKEQYVSISVKNQGEEEEKADQLQANDDPYSLSQISEDLKPQDKIEKQDSSQTDNDLNEDAREHGVEEEDEPNWRQLFLSGLEDREKKLLTEYTTILRNYKEVKKQLGEVEKKNRDSLIETTFQLKELRNANGMKDEEIQSLRQKLSFLVTTLDDNPDLKELKDSYHHPTLNLLDDQVIGTITRSDESTATKSPNLLRTEKEGEEDIKVILSDQPRSTSAIEEKFRMKIDEVLEENLDFWLNFSSSFHEIQKFQTGVEDLQAEISKLEGRLKKKQDGSIVKDPSLKSDARPIYKHLREIETELTLWLEQSVLLKDESQSRFTSLCNIQEDISRALKAGCEDEEAMFTSFQAAKFQGEVLNMKQENSKVAEELQAGLDHAIALQLDIQKTLAKLDEDFELSGTKNHQNSQLKHSTSRSRIPLRSFIFGVKQKRQRMSIFSSMHPVLHRKHNDLRAGNTV